MKKLEKITIKILLMILPIIFFSSNVFANELDSIVNEYDSIYRYSALENKINFSSTINNYNSNNLEEKLLTLDPEISTIINDNTEKLKDITEKQTISIEESDSAIIVIENRGALKVFLVGNKLGVLKYQMIQMKDEINILSALSLDAVDRAEKNQINNQLEVLKIQQAKVEDFIIKQEDRFSLFGWLVSSL